MIKQWVIISRFKDNSKNLYWNNNIGWVDKSLATKFSKKEIEKFLYLPFEAKGWRKI